MPGIPGMGIPGMEGIPGVGIPGCPILAGGPEVLMRRLAASSTFCLNSP